MEINNLVETKDVITYSNLSKETKYLTVFSLSCYGEETELNTICVPGESEVKLNSLNMTDGIFIVRLYDKDKNFEKEFEPLIRFLNLEYNIINRTNALICGCDKCKNCLCSETPCDNLKSMTDLFTMGMSYLSIFKDSFSLFTDIQNKFRCDYMEKISSLTREQILTGKTDTMKLYNKTIISFFLAIYNYNLNLKGLTEDELIYIKKKFKSSELFSCIRDYGLEPNNLVSHNPMYGQVYIALVNNTEMNNLVNKNISVGNFLSEYKDQLLNTSINKLFNGIDLKPNFNGKKLVVFILNPGDNYEYYELITKKNGESLVFTGGMHYLPLDDCLMFNSTDPLLEIYKDFQIKLITDGGIEKTIE